VSDDVNIAIFFYCSTALLGPGSFIVVVSRSHTDTINSVGLLWTSDQPDTGTPNWPLTTLARNPCLLWDSNSQYNLFILICVLLIYVFFLLWLCILIVCLCMATLTEAIPCFFLSCKANVRVKPAKTGHGTHSSKFLRCSMYFCVDLCIVCFVSFSVLFVCVCVLYDCHWVATQLQLNISYQFQQASGRRPKPRPCGHWDRHG
jgi:hypothetical protein